MLTKLSISNFAIIEQTEIEFSPSFNVITGETGAGKSILLGALSLILGSRADLNQRKDEKKKTIIEAVFSIEKRLEFFFTEHDLDFDEETIIRRELLTSGKSRAFINDTPVSLSQLRSLTFHLIDLHQQHDSLSVTEVDFQREILDNYIELTPIVNDYHQQFLKWKSMQKSLQQKTEKQKVQKQHKEFIQFQYDELEKANLSEGELEKIEKDLNKIYHAEEISTSLQAVNHLLNGEDEALTDQLRKAIGLLRKLSDLDASFNKITKRVESALIDIDDIIDELQSIDSIEEVEETQLKTLTERSDLLNRLLKKHEKTNERELIDYFIELEEELESAETLQEEIDDLHKQIGDIEALLKKKAQKITKARMAAKISFENNVKILLEKVGMPKANFILNIEPSDLGQHGQDNIQFLFSANRGISARPIKQIASGGELSRLMLVLKTISGKTNQIATLVFDEIDTGISGEVAKKVGGVLKQLSKNHQVIVITHSPQVAAKGSHHFKVYKKDKGKTTYSTVTALSKEERIQELAEMLSGANPSKSSLSAAKELMA